jgi:hypothetical protein
LGQRPVANMPPAPAVTDVAGVVQPWASFYADHGWLQTTLLFAHLAGIFLGGGFAIATDSQRGSRSADAGFEDLLDRALIDVLYSYTRARSDGSLPPGRPRRAPAAP